MGVLACPLLVGVVLWVHSDEGGVALLELGDQVSVASSCRPTQLK